MKTDLLAFILILSCLACSTKKNGTTTVDEPQNKMEQIDLFEEVTHEDRVQIELKPLVKAKTFEKDFIDYDLKLLNQTSRSKTQFHYSFDPSTIDLYKIIELIGEHPDVIKVASISYTSKKKK